MIFKILILYTFMDHEMKKCKKRNSFETSKVYFDHRMQTPKNIVDMDQKYPYKIIPFFVRFVIV